MILSRGQRQGIFAVHKGEKAGFFAFHEFFDNDLGSRVAKLDIKEYDLNIAMNQGMRKAFDIPLGEGSVDWAKVRKELKAIKYQGWATAEVRGGDRKRLADVAEQMNRVLDL